MNTKFYFATFQKVEERALEVWGSEDALEAEHTKRDVKKDQVRFLRINPITHYLKCSMDVPKVNFVREQIIDVKLL